MSIKDFINKTVVDTETKKRYKLTRITSPEIGVEAIVTNANGTVASYRYDTINGDPFSNGVLKFEDETLLEPFNIAYRTHCRSEEGRMEEYGYWMRRA